MPGVTRIGVFSPPPCRASSCPAAGGIRCVNPSTATVWPSVTSAATASARVRISATPRLSCLGARTGLELHPQGGLGSLPRLSDRLGRPSARPLLYAPPPALPPRAGRARDRPRRAPPGDRARRRHIVEHLTGSDRRSRRRDHPAAEPDPRRTRPAAAVTRPEPQLRGHGTHAGDGHARVLRPQLRQRAAVLEADHDLLSRRRLRLLVG